jgi:hypothetical protein
MQKMTGLARDPATAARFVHVPVCALGELDDRRLKVTVRRVTAGVLFSVRSTVAVPSTLRNKI